MCKYCERRTDMKLGWNQPELPWHDNQDITRNISGNMIHTNENAEENLDDSRDCGKLAKERE